MLLASFIIGFVAETPEFRWSLSPCAFVFSLATKGEICNVSMYNLCKRLRYFRQNVSCTRFRIFFAKIALEIARECCLRNGAASLEGALVTGPGGTLPSWPPTRRRRRRGQSRGRGCDADGLLGAAPHCAVLGVSAITRPSCIS